MQVSHVFTPLAANHPRWDWDDDNNRRRQHHRRRHHHHEWNRRERRWHDWDD